MGATPGRAGTGETVIREPSPQRAGILALALSLLLLPWPARSEPAGARHDLILDVGLDRNRVYPGEAVGITATLLVGQVAVRNIRYPALKDERGRPVEFASPQGGSQVRDGREYAVHAFPATIRPAKSGEWQLGPAEIACDVLVPGGAAAGFFADHEPRATVVRAAPVKLTVLPLPAAGRPGDFSGAVGAFTVARHAAPLEVARGDPVTVSTRIEGSGNIEAFTCPTLELPGVRAYPPKSRRVGRALTCEQVIQPQATGELLLPAAGASFFDPGAGRYRRVRSEALRVVVRAPVSPPQVAAPAAASIAARPAEGSRPSVQRWLAPLAGLLLLGLVVLGLRRLWPRAVTTGPLPPARARPGQPDWLAEARRALEAGDAERLHTAAYRYLQARIGARHGLIPGAISGEAVGRVLRPSGMGEDIAQSYETLFTLCDRARYGPAGAGEGGLREAGRLLERIARED